MKGRSWKTKFVLVLCWGKWICTQCFVQRRYWWRMLDCSLWGDLFCKKITVLLRTCHARSIVHIKHWHQAEGCMFPNSACHSTYDSGIFQILCHPSNSLKTEDRRPLSVLFLLLQCCLAASLHSTLTFLFSFQKKHILGFKCESRAAALSLWRWAVDRYCFFT